MPGVAARWQVTTGGVRWQVGRQLVLVATCSPVSGGGIRLMILDRSWLMTGITA